MLAAEGVDEGELGLAFVPPKESRALKQEHLGIDEATDVLSFPMLPPEAFAPGASRWEEPRPPGTRPHLGDMVVSVERAREQAAAGRGGQTGDVRWSAADEVRLLVIHGTLHICGRDHAEPTEEAAMRALEQRLLSTA